MHTKVQVPTAGSYIVRAPGGAVSFLNNRFEAIMVAAQTERRFVESNQVPKELTFAEEIKSILAKLKESGDE